MQKIHTTDEEIIAMQNYLDDLLDEDKKKKRFTKERVKSAIFGIVLLLLVNLLFSVFSARGRGITPSILGFQFYQIESGSMEPTFEIGDIIISRQYDGRKLAVDDIITFHTTDNMTVTHRIVEILEDENGYTVYRTKGDNPDNSVDQEFVTEDRILAITITKLPIG